MAYANSATGVWTSGLCECFLDCASCCCVIWCPCVVVGRLVEIIDQGFTSCCSGGCLFCWLHCATSCGYCYTCGYRARLRAKYSLPAEPCGDYCVDYWCLGCSLCQQYRELESRGIDPSLGWPENRIAYEQSAPQQTAPGQQKMPQY